MIKKLIQASDRALQIHAATGASDEEIRFFSDGLRNECVLEVMVL